MNTYFQSLLEEAGKIDSTVVLNERVAEWFESLQDLPGWRFDPDAERAAAAALAERNPDILVQSVYLWNSQLTVLGSRPRTY
ncbi:MAG: hypothetical protein NXI02_32905, partial [Rhodobacteraceae bacterium]|nr:hypothetical protein [Paracoccaceae bacterium]